MNNEQEIRFIKDGDTWIAVLADFQNLQVSPAHPINNKEFHNKLEFIYRHMMIEISLDRGNNE